MSQPRWLDQAQLHSDMICRSDKEKAPHFSYSDAEVRQAIIHLRADLTITISLLTTACRFLAAISLTLRVLAGVVAGFVLWYVMH